MKKEGYSYRLIAFVDILGFEDMLLTQSGAKALKLLRKFYDGVNLDGDLSKIQKISEIPNKTKAEFKRYGDLIDEQITTFSDLTVISVSGNREVFDYAFRELISKLERTQYELFKAGYLIRGGITYDLLHHNESFCVGPGLVKSYQLESKAAKYPRIIIDPNIYRFKVFRDKISKHYMLILDFSDSIWQLDIFVYISKNIPKNNKTINDLEIKTLIVLRELMNQAESIISKMLSSKNTNVNIMGRWMGKRYNNLFETIIDRYKEPMLNASQGNLIPHILKEINKLFLG